MSQIHYLIGDATNPATIKGNKIIAHVCNDVGGWGAGFVLAVSKRWKLPEICYREWSNNCETFHLGNTQFVKLELTGDSIVVANMIAQSGIINKNNPHPLNYKALRATLTTVGLYAQKINACVVIPDMIGCGLAGGIKGHVEDIIEHTLIAMGVDVYAYRLK